MFLDECFIIIIGSIFCRIVLADVLIEMELLGIGGGLTISVVRIVLLGLGNAVANLVFAVCDRRWADNSVVVSG